MQFASSGAWYVFLYCLSYFYAPTTFVFNLDNIYFHRERQTLFREGQHSPYKPPTSLIGSLVGSFPFPTNNKLTDDKWLSQTMQFTSSGFGMLYFIVFLVFITNYSRILIFTITVNRNINHDWRSGDKQQTAGPDNAICIVWRLVCLFILFFLFFIPTTFVFRLDNIYFHPERQTRWALVTDDKLMGSFPFPTDNARVYDHQRVSLTR